MVDNPNVYYTNYDLKIHVDRYDCTIWEFSIILEMSAELISKIFNWNIVDSNGESTSKT